MKELSASDAFRYGAYLGSTVSHLYPRPEDDVDDSYREISDDYRDCLVGNLKKAMAFCQTIDLPVSEKAVRNAVAALDRGARTQGVIHPLLNDFQNRLADELESHLYLYIPHDHAKWYQKPCEGWDKTLMKFQASAGFDIEEGSKCLSLERNTACVFHMMRVMEVGLRNIVGVLGIELERHERSWGTILGKVKTEIDRRNKLGEENWKPQRAFFEDVYVSLIAVKDAWRNTTMHVEKVYDSGRAEEIYRMVRGFMERIATRLPEEKPGLEFTS